MKTSSKGVELIKHYESLHDGDLSEIGLQPKEDPDGIWTVGYGHALTNEHGAFLRGQSGLKKAQELYSDLMNMTIDQAERLLERDLLVFEKIVNKRVKIQLNQDQFDSLVSYTFNTGGSDTLFDLVNNKADNDTIYKWFTEHYITTGGVFMRGLLYRRQTEAHLFLTGELKFYN